MRYLFSEEYYIQAATEDSATSESPLDINDSEPKQDLSKPCADQPVKGRDIMTVKNIGTFLAISYLMVLAIDKKLRSTREKEVLHFEENLD